MSDFQDFKRRKIMPIKSIEQIAASYMVAQIISEIRTEVTTKNENNAKDLIPKLEFDVGDRMRELYFEACKIVRYKPILMYIMKFSIEDMIIYNFNADPSVVVAASNDIGHLKEMFGNSFTTLAKISLFNHTEDVFDEAILAAKRTGRSSGVVLPLIAALLHDFGKSSGIRDKILGEAGSRGYKAHAEVSGSYIRDVLSLKLYNKFEELPEDTINILIALVLGHHPANNKTKDDLGITFVMNADKMARQKEYTQLTRNNKE
jgi:hypothetical protein